MPAFELVDSGEPVPLRGLLPAVILLTDTCACPTEVANTIAVAPPGVTVIAINPDPAVCESPPPFVRSTTQPTGYAPSSACRPEPA